MKKLIFLFVTLVSLSSVFIGCTSTQLEKYFELEETTETVEGEEIERQY